MKSIFAALTLMITLPCMSHAQNAPTPEFYVLQVSFEYNITTPRDITAATQAGVPLNDKIDFTMTFPRPTCLGFYDARSASYPATQTDLSAFGRTATGGLKIVNTGMPTEGRMIVINDENGEDIVQLNVLVDNVSLGGQPLTGMTLRTFNLPSDALDSDDFIADGDLLQETLRYPQLQAYVQLGNSGSPTFFMQTSSVEVAMEHFSPITQSGQYATCARP